MKKLVKQIFSRQALFKIWLPGAIFVAASFILDRVIPEFSVVEILGSVIYFLYKILIIKISFWILLVLVFCGFIIQRIKRKRLSERQKFMLAIMNKREVRLIDLAFAYKKRWNENSRLKTKCFNILNKLERLNLVELGCHGGGINTVQEELFRPTKKGEKRIRKIKEEIKEKAEEIYDEVYRKVRDIEPKDAEIEEYIKDIIYILKFPANNEDKKELKSILRSNYSKKFTENDLSNFNFVWSILERKRLIEYSGTGNVGSYSELPYYITDKGLSLYNNYKDVLED